MSSLLKNCTQPLYTCDLNSPFVSVLFFLSTIDVKKDKINTSRRK